jgi:SPX domain protein involved in polyphosphate accumulation
MPEATPQYTKLENYRYERKFRPSALSYHQTRNIVLSSAAFFRQIHHKRYVNNIYLDTPQLNSYYDNLAGIADRKKYRIRWYGDNMGLIKGGIFEIKIKDAFRGTKLSFFLPDFVIDENFSSKTCQELLRNSEIPMEVYDEIAGLELKLLNRYQRDYYRDISGLFRLTIDSEIEYYRLQDNYNYYKDHFNDSEIVVEIKYDEEHNDLASSIVNTLPFTVTRNSKYIEGISRFYEVSL